MNTQQLTTLNDIIGQAADARYRLIELYQQIEDPREQTLLALVAVEMGVALEKALKVTSSGNAAQNNEL